MALINCPECNHEVSDQAEQCNQCAYPFKKAERTEKTKGSVINWVVLIIVLGGAAWTVNHFYQQQINAEKVAQENEQQSRDVQSRTAGALAKAIRIEAEAEKIKASMIVTAQNYTDIKEGMKYSQVEEIIGSPGEEISRSKMDLGDGTSVLTVMVQWQNPDGSNMNAMFQNNQLIQKAQYGLE